MNNWIIDDLLIDDLLYEEPKVIPCSDSIVLSFFRNVKIEFFKFVQDSPDSFHPDVVEENWIGLNTNFKIDVNNFPFSSNDCTICLMKVVEQGNGIVISKVSVNELKIVLESVIHLRNSETPYAFLLWYLDNIDWDASDLIKSLESFRKKEDFDYLINIITNTKTGLYKVLSYNKQKSAQEVANRYGKSISLTKPPFLNPLDNTDFSFEKSNVNLFKYINEELAYLYTTYDYFDGCEDELNL